MWGRLVLQSSAAIAVVITERCSIESIISNGGSLLSTMLGAGIGIGMTRVVRKRIVLLRNVVVIFYRFDICGLLSVDARGAVSSPLYT